MEFQVWLKFIRLRNYGTVTADSPEAAARKILEEKFTTADAIIVEDEEDSHEFAVEYDYELTDPGEAKK